MSVAADEAQAERPPARLIVPALGITQILAWGSSYYLPAVLAKPIADDTGWSLTWVIGALSLGLLMAGLASPFVGRQIHRHGGRPVLIASALLLAAGQLGLAVSPNLPVFIAAWLVTGLGMSAGLYDAAFSTLGRIYGQDARQHITTLTLFGGFASTVCWPLSAYLPAGAGMARRLRRLCGDPAGGLPRHLSARAAPRTAQWSDRRRAGWRDVDGQGRPETALDLHPACGHDHHRLDAVDRHVRASADHPAGPRHHAGSRRRPGRAGGAIAGRRPVHRDADRQVSSSDLDQGRVGQLPRARAWPAVGPSAGRLP